MFTPTLRSLFARLPSRTPLTNIPLRTSPLPPTRSTAITLPSLTTSCQMLHTTSPQNAKPNSPKSKSKSKGQGGGRTTRRGKRGKGKGEGPDPRIVNLKSSMPRAVPAPLRFARNRALRHWTIHRAWLLYQRKERVREERELERMYNSMNTACEELRKMSGPGARPEGYLYRVAMEKKGIYGHGGIPIEYARAQTETPAREPWNHGWTRS
ncbi:uncharacterized protein GGS22DRAFT_168872 [Annulohypoxylon maeteangense]|uniref:uncharacterized protein n=1 Tax=Annulohypoxylon maeteangense TaxID=1927788 RepID=UPI00200882C2|nr:uncharacterized protein GGS22DRAFT_168872 [Annulohypoxylon maeteangense]KAI0882818.1 hypothetical protein GGS22DRAFT_168872 [Annulohypoxylon maeteangense]